MKDLNYKALNQMDFKWRRGVVLFGVVLVLFFYYGIALPVLFFQPLEDDPVNNISFWQKFNGLDGLGVNCMEQTPDSTLWFGVNQGLVSYNGLNWVKYDSCMGEPADKIVTLLKTSEGSLIAGSTTGLYMVDNNVLTPLFLFSDFFWQDYNIVQSPDSSLLIPTRFGVLRWYRNEFYLYATTDNIFDFKVNPNRSVHFQNGQAFHLDSFESDQKITFSNALYTVELNLDVIDLKYKDLFQPRNLVFDVFNHRIWYAVQNGDVGWFRISKDKDDSRLFDTFYTENDGLVYGETPYLFQTQDGAIWVLSEDKNSGVHVFENEKWRYIDFTSLGGFNRNSDLIEADDEIWITGSQSFHVLKNDDIKIYTYSSLKNKVPSNRTFGLVDLNGDVWLCGENQFVSRFVNASKEEAFWNTGVLQLKDDMGANWYIDNNSDVIQVKQEKQTRFGVKEGLMSHPQHLFGLKNGQVWAMGSHNGVAATAFYENNKWVRTKHPNLSWSIGYNAILEDQDGHLWISGAVDFAFDENFKGGLLEFIPNEQTGGEWYHHLEPNAPDVSYGLEQSPDGRIWSCGYYGIKVFDGQIWQDVLVPGLEKAKFDNIVLDPAGRLWFCSRGYGIVVYNGNDWKILDTSGGLIDNNIREVVFLSNNRVVISTKIGINYGILNEIDIEMTQWFDLEFPFDLDIKDYIYFYKESDSKLWLNFFNEFWFLQPNPEYPKIDYDFDKVFSVGVFFEKNIPETTIFSSFDKVASPGNVVIRWDGNDRWQPHNDNELLYSYQLDDGNWSEYTPETNNVFLNLSPGMHTIQIRAMNKDLNVDPTPAKIHFHVLPPIWKQNWFVGMMMTLLLVITFLIFRNLKNNVMLETQNKELMQAKKLVDNKNMELANINKLLENQLIAIREAQVNIASMARFPNENPSPVIRIDETGVILFANESSFQLLSQWDVKIGNTVPDYIFEIILKAERENKVQEYIEQCHEEYYYKLTITPISGESYFNIYGMEVTDQILFENELKKSLSEKEVLLKEIHHRVKNNLQIISSLLYLQGRNHPEDNVQNVIEESRNRVKTIALVHERLYQTNDLSKIDFKSYMQGIVDHISYLFKEQANNVKVNIDIPDDVGLDIDRSIPCGLIVNELMTNAFKYAYPDGKGDIYLQLKVGPCNNDYENCSKHNLSIWDEGIGLDSDIDFNSVKSLGLRLVNSLVGQLGGKIEVSNSKGTRFDITYQYSHK